MSNYTKRSKKLQKHENVSTINTSSDKSTARSTPTTTFHNFNKTYREQNKVRSRSWKRSDENASVFYSTNISSNSSKSLDKCLPNLNPSPSMRRAGTLYSEVILSGGSTSVVTNKIATPTARTDVATTEAPLSKNCFHTSGTKRETKPLILWHYDGWNEKSDGIYRLFPIPSETPEKCDKNPSTATIANVEKEGNRQEMAAVTRNEANDAVDRSYFHFQASSKETPSNFPTGPPETSSKSFDEDERTVDKSAPDSRPSYSPSNPVTLEGQFNDENCWKRDENAMLGLQTAQKEQNSNIEERDGDPVPGTCTEHKYFKHRPDRI